MLHVGPEYRICLLNGSCADSINLTLLSDHFIYVRSAPALAINLDNADALLAGIFSVGLVMALTGLIIFGLWTGIRHVLGS